MRVALVLSEAFSGLRRNLSMVVSVVLVTFISLTFVGTAVLMQFQIGQMKTYWYDKAQVAVYLCTQFDANCNDAAVTDAERDAVQDRLDSPTLDKFIDTYYFVDQEEAFDIFVDQFAGNDIVDIADAEQMNETFWVKLTNSREAAVIIEAIAGMPGVQSVVDQNSYLDQIFSILNAASLTAIGIAAVMLVAAVLLISTTIRLSAFSRRRELGIMRLVGASNRFIQIPFVLEGMIASLFGAVLASGAVVGIVHFFVQGYLAENFAGINFVSLEEALLVAPVLIVVGVGLAGISASIAIARYLRV